MNEKFFIKGKIKFKSSLIDIFKKYQGIELLNNLNEMFDIDDIIGSFIDINTIDISEFPYNWTNINTSDINTKSFEFSYCIQSDLIYIIEYFERLLSVISVDFSFFEISFKDTVIEYTLERNKLFKKNKNHQFIYKLINIDETTYFKCNSLNIKSEDDKYFENRFLAEKLLKLETIFREESSSGNFMTNEELINEWLTNVIYVNLEKASEEEYFNENNTKIEINLLEPKDEKLFFSSEESFFNTLYERRITNELKQQEAYVKKGLILCIIIFSVCSILLILSLFNVISTFIGITASLAVIFISLLLVAFYYAYEKGIKKSNNRKRYELLKTKMKGDGCFNGL